MDDGEEETEKRIIGECSVLPTTEYTNLVGANLKPAEITEVTTAELLGLVREPNCAHPTSKEHVKAVVIGL